jgi:general secretion pathway protein G
MIRRAARQAMDCAQGRRPRSRYFTPLQSRTLVVEPPKDSMTMRDISIGIPGRSPRMTGAGARRVAAGFTLIEIMVVVVILGILAALVAPNVIRRIDDAQIAKAKQDIRNYETGLNLFRMDNFKYPNTEQGLQSLVTKPGDTTIRNWREGGYVQGMRKDPWGFDYHYDNPGTHGEYDLYTLGADGQEGGEGINADIGNWNIN